MEPGGLLSGFRKSYLLFPGKSMAWVVNHTPSSHSKAMSDNLFLFFQINGLQRHSKKIEQFKVRLRNWLLKVGMKFSKIP